ncbi:MAG: hypothetical protein DCC55_39670 [Chloroflexi bacterium]|nr:MAG: hypothetical protein DCC55_39670 [Chloroflexota bacterium]
MNQAQALLQEAIFQAIARERRYQDDKYGPKPHTVANFLLIMEAELDEAKRAWVKSEGDQNALREILQVIAVGVACLEQHGIVER